MYGVPIPFLMPILWTFGLFLHASSALAQTPISGTIASDTHWTVAASPYLVSANTTVASDTTLTIDSGTLIYMAANSSLSVHGAIKALGSAAQPIRVLSDKTRQEQVAAPGDWGQWVFEAGSSNQTQLSNVIFEHGKGLVVFGSSPVFNHLDIRNQAGPAISVDLAASPSGVGNKASGNTVNGVLVPAGEITSTVKWGIRGFPYVVASNGISIGPAPVVTFVTPSELQQGETATLTVSGTRLSGLSEAQFDNPGVSVQVLPGSSNTQASLQVAVDAAAPLGLATLGLLVDAGAVKKTDALTITRTQPKLLSLSPASVYAKWGEHALDITGKSLLETSVVEVDGAALSTQFISSTSIRAQLPAQTVAAQKTVRVRTPDPQIQGQTLLSNALSLTVQEPPVITLRGSTEYGPPAAAVSSFVINQPAATVVGDYLLLTIYRRLSVTVPPGFVQLAEVVNPAGWQWATVYGKLADVAGAAPIAVTTNGASPRVGASLLAVRANGRVPVFYGPWTRQVPTQSAVHSVPAATSPATGLAVAISHEGFAYVDGVPTSLYANAPYIPARQLSMPENRFTVATRSVVTGNALGGTVTANLNSDGADMVFVLGW